MAVVFDNRLDKPALSEEILSAMEQVAMQALQERGIPASAEVSLVLCGNLFIQEINREWRNQDSVTDVLSFPMLDDIAKWHDLPQDELLLGDIIISVERAEEQALKFGHSLERELLFLFTHGLLHLLGYDHIEECDRLKMRSHEEKLLAGVGASKDGL
jgi:probable rRNA maturation factor